MTMCASRLIIIDVSTRNLEQFFCYVRPFFISEKKRHILLCVVFFDVGVVVVVVCRVTITCHCVGRCMTRSRGDADFPIKLIN